MKIRAPGKRRDVRGAVEHKTEKETKSPRFAFGSPKRSPIAVTMGFTGKE